MTETNGRADINSLRINRDRKFNDRPPKRGWRWIVWLVVLAALVAGYFAFKERISPATKIRVGTATLLTGTEAEASLVATGYVVAQRKAEVASKGTGRLERLEFEEGDRVKAGQVIAELDNADIKANLAQAKADLQYAEADSLNASRQFQRAADLVADGAITRTDYEQAETTYLLSSARVAAAVAPPALRMLRRVTLSVALARLGMWRLLPSEAWRGWSHSWFPDYSWPRREIHLLAGRSLPHYDGGLVADSRTGHGQHGMACGMVGAPAFAAEVAAARG